jgi:dTDP-3-amino-3,4,6-trideoxy-alpha-D-glucose transaminase
MSLGIEAPRVPVMKIDGSVDPELTAELLEAVEHVARRGAFTGGHEVEAFEEEFGAYCGSPHAIGLASGTDALALAFRGLGIGPGDEVIVPANSFIATAEGVTMAGATPKLVDVDPHTHLLTADAVREAIGPRTKAVAPVHLMGSVVDMDPILEVARAAGLYVVEDCAQAHGAWYRGRRVGSLGDAGCFSFYPTKNLGAWGDGGAVTTKHAEVADRIRLLRSHGERPRYHHLVPGLTCRLDALQAAVLRIKLRRLDGWNDDRRRLGALLRTGLAGTSVELPEPGADHVFHLFVVRTAERDALRRTLEARGVATAVHYPIPIHRTDAYADLGYQQGSLPVAERLAEQICTLPLFPSMSDEEAGTVIESIEQYAREA